MITTETLKKWKDLIMACADCEKRIPYGDLCGVHLAGLQEDKQILIKEAQVEKIINQLFSFL